MTKKKLENYRSKKTEIREVEQKLRNLDEGDTVIGNNVVFDYRTGYPRPQSVVGVDWDKYYDLKESYQSLLDRLRSECAEVEQWINQLPDGNDIRRIFRLRYIDGMTQRQISKMVHLERSSVSKKIDDFLKLSHNSH